MKIVVLAKHVPDTADPRRLSPETGIVDRDSGEAIPDEITERALASALDLAGEHGGAEVVVLTVGPAGSDATLRRLLAMGADRAVHVLDDQLSGSDMLQTATVVAEAVRQEEADLVFAGNQSTDGRGGMVPAMVAELLGRVCLPELDEVALAGAEVTGAARLLEGTVRMSAPLPAVVTVTDWIAEPRFPTFKGIMAAKKKPLEVKSLAVVGVQAGPAYAPVRSVMVSAAPKPAKSAGTVITDDGTAAAQVVDFLKQRHLL